jgi:serine/threonine-protein kinase
VSGDRERWERVQALFHRVLELPVGERRGYLDEACADEPELVDEVLDLVTEDERADSILDREVGSVADAVLDGSVPPIQVVGAYRIRRILGRGGMGVVYLGEREDLGALAAIKVLRDAPLSPVRRERFAREQRTLANLTHPSIARLYDADALPDGTPYFVMEYVEGVPLTEYCTRERASLADRLRLFRAVCEAVQAAHGQAVVHRDLKPSNIVVAANGELKLLDFGIAKQLDDLDVPTQQTETALRLMTPAYAAPEQILGEPIGTYTDIYALGVILYELLAGRLPFDLSRRTPGQAESMILGEDPQRPSDAVRKEEATLTALGTVGRSRWADLDVMCLTAMHKEPGRRYRTVDALVRDLDHFGRGEPLEARPDSVGYRLGKLLRRRWRPLSAAAVAVAAIVGLVAFYTVRLAHARDLAVAEAARAQRIQRFTLNLFQGGDETAGPADSLRVVTLLDRGVNEARVLDAEPGIQAELYQTLGSIYQHLGNLDRADTLLSTALSQNERLSGAAGAAAARGRVALGLLRIDQADVEGAEALVRRGLDDLRVAYPPDDPSVVEAATALGRILQERGLYDEAGAVLGSAVQALESGGPSPELSITMTALANTWFFAGNMQASDSLNRILLDMDRELFGERHPSVGDDLINLGAIQFERGDYVEAERLYREALDILTAYYGTDHPETASNLTRLGQALVYQERTEEAKESLDRALEIRERVFGAVHPAVASTLNDLGILAVQTGDMRGAEQNHRRMMSIYESVYGRKHYLYALAQSNLASVFAAEERWGDAEALYREAVALFAETLGDDHTQTSIARIKVGHTLTKQGRWAEAEGPLTEGYATLSPQMSPTVSWLTTARADLIALYDALGQPEKAARYRTEADTAAAAAAADSAGVRGSG